jgi:hypothetical protein
MPKKSSKEEFINKSNTIHNFKYNYSLVEYINNKTKVKIICKEHGVFEQRPDNHIQKQKCPLCVNTNIKSNKDQFILKSKIKFGDLYDYSLVEYINNKSKVKIICKEHGVFEQKPNLHLSKSVKVACLKCSNEKRMINFEDIIKRMTIKHNQLYDYSKFEYNGQNSKSIIICKKHGEFKQTVLSHLNGIGCKKCKNSTGETTISNILESLNIEYITEYKFNDCIYKKKLPFDFYLPKFNICIEFNGKQHYEKIDFFGGGEYLKLIKKRDNIKRQYCKDNNITLIEIKYNEINNISNIISSYIE